MKILIVGAGAIGTMIGVRLSLSGNDVTFYDKYVRLSKLQLVCGGKAETLEPVRYLDSLCGQQEHYDLLILCIKAYANKAFIEEEKSITFDRLLTIQNGLGNEEILAECFTAVISGTLTLPVSKTEDAVHIRNKGGFGFASVTGSCEPIVTLFSQAGFDVCQYQSYQSMKWSKLLLNMMANAMSAITSMSMGAIFNDRGLTFIEKSAVVEALAVMKEKGIAVVDLPAYPVRMIASFFRCAPPTVIEIAVRMSGKKFSRGDKMPSLYIERQSQSSQSEIDVLNGAVAESACRAGILAPANRFLHYILTSILAGKIDGGKYENNPQAVWADFKAFCDNRS